MTELDKIVYGGVTVAVLALWVIGIIGNIRK